MLKKSTVKKIKGLIYPAAFILIIVLSVVYKLVLKGNGDLTVTAFKSGKTAEVTGAEFEESSASEQEVTSCDSEQASVTTETKALISIYICGEVTNPGIYEAPKGVILNDIIEDAGGFTEDASVNNINLVYQITCNMSVYIPSRSEIEGGFTGGDIIRQDGVYVWGNNSGGGTDNGSTGTLMVNINTASVEELRSLPGIGEVTAQAIADYRKNTPFTAIEDIKNVTGIGDSKYNRIKDYICV